MSKHICQWRGYLNFISTIAPKTIFWDKCYYLAKVGWPIWNNSIWEIWTFLNAAVTITWPPCISPLFGRVSSSPEPSKNEHQSRPWFGESSLWLVFSTGFLINYSRLTCNSQSTSEKIDVKTGLSDSRVKAYWHLVPTSPWILTFLVSNPTGALWSTPDRTSIFPQWVYNAGLSNLTWFWEHSEQSTMVNDSVLSWS